MDKSTHKQKSQAPVAETLPAMRLRLKTALAKARQSAEVFRFKVGARQGKTSRRF